jgi:hypothetical protein
MRRHAYPASAMLADYLRSAAGVLPIIAILLIAPVGVVGATLLGGFGGLFAAFGIRTMLRHRTWLESTEAGLRAFGLRTISICWAELDRMRLTYYSTRRDRREGWMQLELRSGRSVLRVDSRIEGFIELVKASVRAAEMRGLLLDPATSVNLQALRVRVSPVAAGLGEAAGDIA